MHLVAYWQQYCAPYVRARFGNDERGASLVEYALLVALIAVVCIVAIAFLAVVPPPASAPWARRSAPPDPPALLGPRQGLPVATGLRPAALVASVPDVCQCQPDVSVSGKRASAGRQRIV